MKHTLKKSTVLSLLLVLAGGVTVSTQAAEKPDAPAKPTATKPSSQNLSGKVVAVDKTAKSITIEVNGQTYVLNVANNPKFTKGNKEQSLSDVTVGEDISVTVELRESADGRVEVVVTGVELPTTSEAQGAKATGPGNGKGKGPFDTNPNPGNIGGPNRSPKR